MEKKFIYVFKGARHNTDLTAKKIGKVIEKLLDPKGVCSPEALLKESSNKKSSLYNYFVWNNLSAAKNFRLNQARVLIRLVQRKTPG